MYYTGSSIYQQAFAQPGSTATWVQARENIIAWRESTLLIDRGEADLARGWTLSAHHLLNPSDPGTLYKGDGKKLKNNVRILTTAATAQRVGDGLSYPRGVVVDPEGSIFFTDGYNSRYHEGRTLGGDHLLQHAKYAHRLFQTRRTGRRPKRGICSLPTRKPITVTLPARSILPA